jgi:hypothetical protein
MEVGIVKPNDYKPGDLILFFSGNSRFEEGPEEIGWIVRRDYDDPSEPAVMVGFPEPNKNGLLHYYDVELREWEKAGTIEVKRG